MFLRVVMGTKWILLTRCSHSNVQSQKNSRHLHILTFFGGGLLLLNECCGIQMSMKSTFAPSTKTPVNILSFLFHFKSDRKSHELLISATCNCHFYHTSFDCIWQACPSICCQATSRCRMSRSN